MKSPGSDVFSTRGDPSVSSALKRFTSVFGMGTGGTTSLKPPGDYHHIQLYDVLGTFGTRAGVPRHLLVYHLADARSRPPEGIFSKYVTVVPAEHGNLKWYPLLA
mgnify:CR=1 FL=1